MVKSRLLDLHQSVKSAPHDRVKREHREILFV